MLQERDDIVAIDSAILQHPRVWEASGHLAGFTDPLVDCRTVRAALPRRQARGRAVPAQAVQAAGRRPRLRPHRGAPVQPHVRDLRRPGAEDGLRRLPAARDGAGDLRQLQERARQLARKRPLRHRPDRQGVPQRDHTRQLHLPHAGVRADGDGVLRAVRRRRRVARATGCKERHAVVHGPRLRTPSVCGCATTSSTSWPTTPRPRPTSSTVPVRLVRARGHRQPQRLRPARSTPSSPARSWSTSTRRRASTTSPT